MEKKKLNSITLRLLFSSLAFGKCWLQLWFLTVRLCLQMPHTDHKYSLRKKYNLSWSPCLSDRTFRRSSSRTNVPWTLLQLASHHNPRQASLASRTGRTKWCIWPKHSDFKRMPVDFRFFWDSAFFFLYILSNLTTATQKSLVDF